MALGASDNAVAIILVGGPTKGTRFRPLSFNVAKPLFPLAGQPMIHHPILACTKIPNLQSIYLLGFYDEKEFSMYTSALSSELRIPVRYVRETKPYGSAGGLHHFRDVFLEEDPRFIFVLHCDVCCTFPLEAMLESHKVHGGVGTLLAKKVARDKANELGVLVADPETREVMHYTERPETFVSDLINCGVYVFSSALFDCLKSSASSRRGGSIRRVPSVDSFSPMRQGPSDYLQIDRDVIMPLAAKKQLFVYETPDFWEQIKTPAMSLRCSELYLEQYRRTRPEILASASSSSPLTTSSLLNDKKGPTIVGDVFIHPSAKVHHSAKLGPNVSVAANARIGAGVRLIDCIILDEVEINENSIVTNAIVGWRGTIGKWARVQGGGNHAAKLGITILGENVTVEDEIVVVNCVVLPHKSLSQSVREEIIL